MSYKLVVTFQTEEQRDKFQDLVNEHYDVRVGPATFYSLRASKYNPNVSNEISGSASNVMQCGNIDGGVRITNDRDDISDRWYPR